MLIPRAVPNGCTSGASIPLLSLLHTPIPYLQVLRYSGTQRLLQLKLAYGIVEFKKVPKGIFGPPFKREGGICIGGKDIGWKWREGE